MATAPIIFTGTEDGSSSQLAGAQPLVVNAMPDEYGAIRRRPGIKAWSTFPTEAISGSPVIGMCAFGETLVYITEDRKIHSITAQGELHELSDSTVATQLEGTGRPVFVPGREMMVIAGSGALQKWTGAGLSARLTNTGVGGDPPNAAFICAVAQRLVAQRTGDSGQFWWTGPLEQYENWDMATGGASYIQATAKPDPLVAILDNTNEIFAFGRKTLQVYAPSSLSVDSYDVNNIIDFAPNRTQNIGTNSPYSIVPYGDNFGLIDKDNRAILTDGRTYQDISAPVAQILNELEVDKSWGFQLRFGRFDAIVYMFPEEGYGLIVDVKRQRWCEWRAWNNGEKDVTITSAFNWPEKKVFLVGMNDGSIAQLDANTHTDLTDPIKIQLISGFSNRGTNSLKECISVSFQFKRTWVAEAESGRVRISWRKYEGAWTVLRDTELSSFRETLVQIRSVGNYRTAQWRVEYTGTDEFQLVSAEEEFQILET